MTSPVSLTVVLCDDAHMEELNRRYLRKSGPTDVLAFPDVETVENGTRYLGDIVISVTTAHRHARRYKVSLQKEILRLSVHGLLHLLGYRDSRPEERRAMAVKERSYLKAFDDTCNHRKARASGLRAF